MHPQLPFEPPNQGEEIAQHLGQIFTPPSVANLLVSMAQPKRKHLATLDAGAGAGALTDALLASATLQDVTLELTLVERDELLVGHLRDASKHWESRPNTKISVISADFFEFAASTSSSFDLIITNPPYARLFATLPETGKLRKARIRVPNLYAAFMWQCVSLLAPGGELLAIVPRSFCAGAQFKWLRQHIFASCSVTSIHLFESREEVFREDRVLQETVIVAFQKDSRRDGVRLSWSSGSDSATTQIETVPTSRVVVGDKMDRVILIPDSPQAARASSNLSQAPLLHAGLAVSTGSVVDFRLAQHISDSSNSKKPGTYVPLIGSTFVGSGSRRRSLQDQRHLEVSPATNKHIFPPGDYIVLNRISPKESTPRIRPRLVSREDLASAPGVAFENHVNVIHRSRHPLNGEDVADVLPILQSQLTQMQLAERAGSTQVNASDIKSLRRPATEGDRNGSA